MPLADRHRPFAALALACALMAAQPALASIAPKDCPLLFVAMKDVAAAMTALQNANAALAKATEPAAKASAQARVKAAEAELRRALANKAQVEARCR